jgi:hypothetical protein
MMRYDTVPNPMFETAFRHIGWVWAGQIVAWGEAVLLPLVVLLSFIAQPELMCAMAIDGACLGLLGCEALCVPCSPV